MCFIKGRLGDQLLFQQLNTALVIDPRQFYVVFFSQNQALLQFGLGSSNIRYGRLKIRLGLTRLGEKLIAVQLHQNLPLSYGISNIDFAVVATDDDSVTVTEDSRFLGPTP